MPTIIVIDDAQYQPRLEQFDYDVVTARFAGGVTPGIDLRNSYSSSSARAPGSYNLSGIENPAVDELVEKVISATSRKDLTTAARALDRVLRAERYWVSEWYFEFVQAGLLERLLATGGEAGLRPCGRRHLVVRCGKGQQAEMTRDAFHPMIR